MAFAQCFEPLLCMSVEGLKQKPNAHAHVQSPSKKHPPTLFFINIVTYSVLMHFKALLSQWSSKTPSRNLKQIHVEGVKNVTQKSTHPPAWAIPPPPSGP
jgi:hypothetical protein